MPHSGMKMSHSRSGPCIFEKKMSVSYLTKKQYPLCEVANGIYGNRLIINGLKMTKKTYRHRWVARYGA
jgi:hypothetical protein